MTLLLLIIVTIAGGVMLNDQSKRIRRLEDTVDALRRLTNARSRDDQRRDRPPEAEPLQQRPSPWTAPPAPQPQEAEPESEAEPEPVPEPAMASQRWDYSSSPPPPPEPAMAARSNAPPLTMTEAPPSRSFAETFEAVVGGKLPIWVGGIALILAAIFLVRYSIEAGLLGPGVRCIMAAIFGVALLGGSEAARRIPRFADDPRVGQALAGAGIASLFGTLYMASELYGLIGALPAFILLVIVTAVALFLSLRHGPPTAIMGMIGGFAAPYVAGLNEGNLVPVLVYLALLMGALFALAIHRGWTWLALAATGGGVLWSVALMIAGDGSQLAAIGIFVAAIAVAGSLGVGRSGTNDWRLRLAPMAAGFLQLALLAPLIEFSLTGWMLYGLLSAAMVFLAWRDPKMTPGVAGALALVLVILAGAQSDQGQWAMFATAGAILLFAVPGHWLSRRDPDGAWWSGIAIIGGVAPVLIAMALRDDLFIDLGWAAIAVVTALPCLWLAWRSRDDASETIRPSIGVFGATQAATLMLFIAILWAVPGRWYAPLGTLLAMAVLAWGERLKDRTTSFIGPITLAIAFAITPVWIFGYIAASALIGETLHTDYLPDLSDTAIMMLLPAGIAAAGLFATIGHTMPRVRQAMAAAAATMAALALYVFAKQPLWIDTPEAFIANGFLERVLFTQAVFAAGFAILMLAPAKWARLGWAVGLIGAARLIWFDLVVLNPLAVAQNVGTIPVLNIAVLHFAAAGVWFWLAKDRVTIIRLHKALGIAALAAMATALFFAIRQIFHGTLLNAPDVFRGEQYAYSAAFMVLAAVWLWRGVAEERGWLRVAGLALLTGVTLKVFLIDAAALEGLLRVLSFLGLGGALIGIGWGYGRFVAQKKPAAEPKPDPING